MSKKAIYQEYARLQKKWVQNTGLVLGDKVALTFEPTEENLCEWPLVRNSVLGVRMGIMRINTPSGEDKDMFAQKPTFAGTYQAAPEVWKTFRDKPLTVCGISPWGIRVMETKKWKNIAMLDVPFFLLLKL